MASRRRENIVVRALSNLGECNLNVLRKETGLSYYALVRTLHRLVLEGIVIERRVGRLRIFKLAEGQSSA